MSTPAAHSQNCKPQDDQSETPSDSKQQIIETSESQGEIDKKLSAVLGEPEGTTTARRHNTRAGGSYQKRKYNFGDDEFYYGEKITHRNFGLPSKGKEKAKRPAKQAKKKVPKPAEAKPKKKPVKKKAPVVEVYCLCKTSDESRPMIQCEKCDDWFHFDCIGLDPAKNTENFKYFCPQCQPKPKMKLAKSEAPPLKIQNDLSQRIPPFQRVASPGLPLNLNNLQNLI